MSQITIDLSGRKGLGKNFFGDTDMITPQPNLRFQTEEGQLAQGRFNPYFREGYLAPTTTTSIPVTSTATEQFNTVAYDTVNNTSYWGTNGEKIYKSDSLNNNTFTSVININTPNIIEDLEIYQRNSIRSLYYTYKKEKLIFESSMDFQADWMNIGIRVDPLTTTKPILLDKFSDKVKGAPWYGKLLTIPASAPGASIIFILGVPAGASISGPLVGLSAPTLAATYTGTFYGNPWEFRVYYRSGLTAGNYVCTASLGGGVTGFMYALAFKETSATPVTVTSSTRGSSLKALVEVAPLSNASYLNFIFSSSSFHIIPSTHTLVDSYNPGTQTGNLGYGLTFSPEGTRMIVQGMPSSLTILYKYTLSTPFTLSTATYAPDSLNINGVHPATNVNIEFNQNGNSLFTSGTSFSSPNTLYKWTGGLSYNLAGKAQTSSVNIPESASMVSTGGFTFTKDGLHLYWAYSTSTNQSFIGHYTLSTAFDLTTLSSSAIETFRVTSTSFPLASLRLSSDDTILYGYVVNDELLVQYDFNPLFPRDISRVASTRPPRAVPFQSGQFYVRPTGIDFFIRRTSNDDVERYVLGGPALGLISSQAELLGQQDPNVTSVIHSLYLESDSKTLECGVVKLPLTFYNDSDLWLTDKQGLYVRTNSDYNFIRSADNGFAYIFAQNKVIKIDGGFTGGEEGLATNNVLLFPENFTITDAVDYRSNLYLALHQYPTSIKSTTSNLYNGKCGIFVWDRETYKFKGSNFIEIPGVREIKKIYSSPDGTLKLLTISDNGLTELRQFGYNDSGGVVFPIKSKLGLGAFPQVPDGLTVAGDKVMWLANDGTIYCEKENAITQLFQVKVPGVTSTTLANNIKSGAVFYGSSLGTTINNNQTNRQALYFSYLDSATASTKIISPFDLTMYNNTSQTIAQGDVYTGVSYIPITSVVRNIRIYNAPIVGTGTGTIATVKVYFNQSTTATVPSGMTKSVSKNEAKRGYVDFKINNPNIHSVQIEIEWNNTETLGVDTYLPSFAIITYDETTTQSPDNG